MATAEAVAKSVDLLGASYGRNPTENAYLAYSAALVDVDDNELTVATARCLRGGGQFMPSAAEVFKAAGATIVVKPDEDRLSPTTPGGNNGVGNGVDPQPPGNPPVNDGPGTGPGNPGNQGGKKK